jgi:bifunctional non-homologous end joining protein LigD
MDALGGWRVLLDGEIVVLDWAARPSFQLLQRRLRVSRPHKSLVTACGATLFLFCV